MNKHRSKIVSLLKSKQDKNIMLAFQLHKQAGFDIKTAWRWIVYGFFKSIGGKEYSAYDTLWGSFCDGMRIKMKFCGNELTFMNCDSYGMNENPPYEHEISMLLLINGIGYTAEFMFNPNNYECPKDGVYKGFTPEQQTLWVLVNKCLTKCRHDVLKFNFGEQETPINFGLFANT